MRIHGTAAGGAAVRVVDCTGQVLGVTSADANGEWSIDDLQLGVGDHTVRGEVSKPGGRLQLTDWIDVSVEPELSAVEKEYAAMLAEEDRERTERWEGIYCQAVEALADGGDVDFEFMHTLLGALGKTLDEFSADIDAMSNALAKCEIHSRCTKAKLNSLGERHNIF
jgi:hypothetical protein